MKYRILNLLLIIPFFIWSQAGQIEVNTTAEWTNIGPVKAGLIRYTPGTGRINQMAIDPGNDQIWYAMIKPLYYYSVTVFSIKCAI